MAPNPFSPHGSAGPIRSQAGILAAITAVGGLVYWIRFRGTEAKSTSIASADRNAKAALGSKNDESFQGSIKGAYGGNTGGNTSLGQKPTS